MYGFKKMFTVVKETADSFHMALELVHVGIAIPADDRCSSPEPVIAVALEHRTRPVAAPDAFVAADRPFEGGILVSSLDGVSQFHQLFGRWF